MEISIDFNIGDMVYLMYYNKVVETAVQSVRCEINGASQKTEVRVCLPSKCGEGVLRWMDAKYLFKSKEELLETL